MKYKMDKIMQLNIKNKSYYFWDDQIYLKNFDGKMIKINKHDVLDMIVYCISHATKKPEYNIYSINPLYLVVRKLDAYVEENNDNKYLRIADIDSNKGFLIKYDEVWDSIKDKTNGLRPLDDQIVLPKDFDYMKIKFNSDDNLPLNKLRRFYSLTIVIREVFEADGKFYLQMFLDNSLYEV